MLFKKNFDHLTYCLIFFLSFISCDINAFSEASGLVFIKEKDLYYSVGDEGYIYEIDENMEISDFVYLGSYDLEAITYDLEQKKLYCLDEKNFTILAVDIETLELIEIIQLRLKKKHEKKYSQFESLTYSNEERLFYFAATNLVNNEGSLFSVGIDGGEAQKEIDFAIEDVSGLSLHKGRFYMVSDREDLITRYDPINNNFISLSIPGDKQEGIAVKPSGDLIIIEESGRISRYHINLFDQND